MKTTPLRLVPTAAAMARLALAAFSLYIIHSSFFISRAAAQTAAQTTPQDHPHTQTATITGRVSSAVTGFYLRDAEVRIAGTNTFVYTGDDGSYTITVPAGPVTITASYTGVQTATRDINATPGASNTLDFDLQAFTLDTRATARPETGTPAVGRPATGDEVVMLDKFTVTEERTGQARAIMTQRAADNAITAISIDNFGDLTSGSIGEFLKYMPGVTVDYGEDEAETVRVAGLDPKYAGFAMDGVAMASSHGTSRANAFTQMSVTGIESIEFHQTLLARMPANTPAGRFELKTRYAFNRKKPELKFQLGLDGNANAIEIGKSYLPDDKKHWRTYPGGQVSYGGAFFKRRLGIEASISRYANYRNNQSHETSYVYRNPAHELNEGVNFVTRNGNLEMEELPHIYRLSWREGPKIWTQQAASLNLDFKITQNLIASLRSSLTVTENEYYNSYYDLRSYEPYSSSADYLGPGNGNVPQLTQDKHTTWIVNSVAVDGTYGRQSIFYSNNGFRNITDTNYLISPRLEYKKGSLQINFRGALSHSRKAYRDTDKGFMRGVSTRLTGMGWAATRASADSPEWYITKTAGTDWSQPENFDLGDTYSMGTTNQPITITNKQTSGYLDLTYALPVLGQPVTLRAGIGSLYSDYYYNGEDNRYTYISPTGNQRTDSMPYTKNYVPTFTLNGKSGNVNDQGWRVNDLFTLYEYWRDHPEWFTVARADNARRNFITVRDLDERIDSAYVEATTRAGRFSFNLGARFEHTKTNIKIGRMRPRGEIDDAKASATPEEIASGKFNYTIDDDDVLTMDTVEGFMFQYYDGQRFPHLKKYDDMFFSGGLKYDFSKNLRFQLSAHQAILRPDYDNLSAPMTYSSFNRNDIVVPNPYLKPEQTLKIYAGLYYYFNPAGTLSLSVFRLDIKNLQSHKDYPQIINQKQAEAQIGYPINLGSAVGSGEDEEGGGESGGGSGGDEEDTFDPSQVVFRSAVNADGTRTVYGITLEYNQQLTFLPGVLKGLSVFGSASWADMQNAREDWELIGQAKTSANGGIKYRYGRFNIQVRATWTDDKLAVVYQAPSNRKWFQHDHVYTQARTIVDLSGGFRLNKNVELTFSIRNLTDSPDIRYSNVQGRLTRYQTYGSIWNVAIRGTY